MAGSVLEPVPRQAWEGLLGVIGHLIGVAAVLC